MKLRVVYGAELAKDKAARRREMRVILLAGFAVFFPFLLITYFLFSETRAIKLLLIGILAALSCVPVVLYAYAKGFGKPLRDIWRERTEELRWLALKIGFLYGFALYWMILGIVEFLFGYQSFRAALISFVASAAARDGFEIGYFRGLKKTLETNIRVFPDDRPIWEMLREAPLRIGLLVLSATIGAGLSGLILSLFDPNPRLQALAAGLVVGALATMSYVWMLQKPPKTRSVIRFFIWPAFTMAVTYFLIFAYLLRIIFQISLPLSTDFGVLMGLCAALLTFETLFIAYIQRSVPVQSRSIPHEHLNKATS